MIRYSGHFIFSFFVQLFFSLSWKVQRSHLYKSSPPCFLKYKRLETTFPVSMKTRSSYAAAQCVGGSDCASETQRRVLRENVTKRRRRIVSPSIRNASSYQTQRKTRSSSWVSVLRVFQCCRWIWSFDYHNHYHSDPIDFRVLIDC